MEKEEAAAERDRSSVGSSLEEEGTVAVAVGGILAARGTIRSCSRQQKDVARQTAVGLVVVVVVHKSSE